MLLYRAARTELSPEERESLAKSLFSDFLSSNDLDEALGTAQELVIPGFGRTLVRIGLEKAFDSLVDAEQVAIGSLIVDLAVRKAISGKDIRFAVDEFTCVLADLSLDVPAAPKILGRVMGLSAAEGLLPLDVTSAMLGVVEDTEPRRAFIVATLLAFQESKGDDAVIAALQAVEMNVLDILEHDTEFEAHLQPAKTFAEEQGISKFI